MVMRSRQDTFTSFLEHCNIVTIFFFVISLIFRNTYLNKVLCWPGAFFILRLSLQTVLPELGLLMKATTLLILYNLPT